jgi:hypothetical protein
MLQSGRLSGRIASPLKKMERMFARHGLIHRARLPRPTPPRLSSSPPPALRGRRPPSSAAPALGSLSAWPAQPPIG